MRESACADWVRQTQGEGPMTAVTLVNRTHLTQLPPQPFRGEIRERFCLQSKTKQKQPSSQTSPFLILKQKEAGSRGSNAKRREV